MGNCCRAVCGWQCVRKTDREVVEAAGKDEKLKETKVLHNAVELHNKTGKKNKNKNKTEVTAAT